MRQIKNGLLFALLFLFSVSTAVAAVPDRLLEDLTLIDGIVLKVSDSEVLIDAAALKGVRSGDLFSISGKSEQIVHPVTGAVLGERQHSGGLLQVTQVGSGFSVTRQLAGEAPQVGTTIQRNSQVEAYFMDLGTAGELFAAEIQQALPQLLWKGYKRTDQQGLDTLRVHGSGFNGLLFLLNGDRLEVRGPDFELLRSYDHINLQVSTSSSPTLTATPSVPVLAPVQNASLPAVTAPVATTPSVGGLIPLWSGMSAKELPIGLVVLDLDADGKQEIARAFEDRLEIGRLIGERYTHLQTIDVASWKKVLSLSALDLNANGKPELFMTAMGENGISSDVFEYGDGEYQVLAEKLRWFLNVVNLPGEGSVLLGQVHDQSYTGFSSSVHRLAWQSGKLVETTPFALPDQGTIYSLAALPGSNTARMLRINHEGRVEIYEPTGEPLWISSDRGASETVFTQPDPQGASGSEAAMKNETFLPTPLLTLADGSILTLMNSEDVVSGVFGQMTSVEISLRKWDGVDLKPVWVQKLDGYVPAAVIADANNDGRDELAVLLALPTLNPFASRKSAVRLYDLK